MDQKRPGSLPGLFFSALGSRAWPPDCTGPGDVNVYEAILIERGIHTFATSFRPVFVTPCPEGNSSNDL
jgi:hypothetical protein